MPRVGARYEIERFIVLPLTSSLLYADLQRR